MYKHSFPSDDRLDPRRLVKFALTLTALSILWLALSGCTASTGSVTVPPAERDAALRQIAADYVSNGDLSAATAALDKLGLANPGQLIVALAEKDLSAGRSKNEIESLARLAESLGARSARLVAYLAPTAAPVAPAAVPPTQTTAPSPTAVPATATATTVASSTATVEPTEAIAAATTAAPSATPAAQKPRVLAENTVNLRSGPGRAYPVIGRLNAGQEVAIVGRNASGDWWRLQWAGTTQAWVAGTVVRVLGAIDTVAQAKDIPVAPTAAPQPTAPPAPPVVAQPTTPPQPAGPDFRVENIRLWNVVENGGSYDGTSVHCGEKRELRVIVLDAGGNRLDGVTIKVVYGNQEEAVTGSKGPGEAEFVLGGGQDVYVIRDVDGRQANSDFARGLSTNPAAISYDVLMGAGYCRDAADCAHFVSQNGCYAHYSWTVTFRRSY